MASHIVPPARPLSTASLLPFSLRQAKILPGNGARFPPEMILHDESCVASRQQWRARPRGANRDTQRCPSLPSGAQDGPPCEQIYAQGRRCPAMTCTRDEATRSRLHRRPTALRFSRSPPSF